MSRIGFTEDGSPDTAAYDVVMLGDSSWEAVRTRTVLPASFERVFNQDGNWITCLLEGDGRKNVFKQKAWETRNPTFHIKMDLFCFHNLFTPEQNGGKVGGRQQ